MSATDCAGKRPPTAPPLLTERNIGPAVIPAASSHVFKAVTGQATLPRRIAIVCPALSWSVLLYLMMTLNPSSLSSRSSTSSAIKFGSAESPSEADQQQGAVALALDVIVG